MSYNLSWTLFLIVQFASVILHPIRNQQGVAVDNFGKILPAEDTTPNQDHFETKNEQVISVRITSSVAVGRTNNKTQTNLKTNDKSRAEAHESNLTSTSEPLHVSEYSKNKMTDIPPDLVGANIEYIKQLNAKKEAKEHNLENSHPFELSINSQRYNKNDEILEGSSSIYDEIDDDVENIEDVPLARKIPSSVNANHVSEKPEPSQPNDSNESYMLKHDEKNEKKNSSSNGILKNEKPVLQSSNTSKVIQKNETQLSIDEQSEDFEIDDETSIGDNIERNTSNQTFDSTAESSIKSVQEVTTKFLDAADTRQDIHAVSSQQNYLREFRNKPLMGREHIPRLTTVSFNIVHDDIKGTTNYNEQTTFTNPTHYLAEPVQVYEQPKIYSEPARIYSEPAKFYSEPAKIYSEPAKVYSEPAKVYSEPAKVYSEPAKFYSEPASLHLSPSVPPNITPWQHYSQSPVAGTTTINTTPVTMITNPSMPGKIQGVAELEPEKNYEVDEKLSIVTNGRSHGVQESTTEKCKQDNCKVGYVVEGRQYKKYRVEERTSDGFIVGEYGVVRNEDGALRGVRYTADSDASPRLIYDALMKFLQLR